MPYVTCPDCNHESLAPRELIGLEWRCPRCGVSFLVGDAGRSASARGRRREKSFVPVAAFRLVIGLLAAGAIFLAVRGKTEGSRRPPSTPIADESRTRGSRPAVNCSLTELVDYLLANRIGSAVQYVRAPPNLAMLFASLRNEQTPTAMLLGESGHELRIHECDDETHAKHGVAGHAAMIQADGKPSTPIFGAATFSWGRFGFVASSVGTGNQVRALLGVR